MASAELEATSPKGRTDLRRTLVTTDVVTVLVAWLLAPLGPWTPAHTPWSWWLVAPAFTALTIAGVAIAGLYRARVCAVRSIEVVRLAYVSMAVGALGAVIGARVGSESVSALVAAGPCIAFLGLIAGRSAYHNWLLAQRATGKLLRSVAIIGADDEASRLGAHLAEHPEVGYDVVGYFRSATGHAAHLARPVLGQAFEAPGVLTDLGLSGAIVVPGALAPAEIDFVLGSLTDAKIHVHLATGLRGIDHRRLRSLPMGHEPLLYLEPAGMHSSWYPRFKRVTDVVGASVGLLLALPVLVGSAIAIKVQDGGPVLFRQARAGKGGRSFQVLKLRTMTVDAEERLADLLVHNEREGGPLFKLTEDPRVTRVGKLLRALSIDELPQLVNVLKGEMSLVGPRPALLDEVAAFDDELLVRNQVRPGVTGLWQVEARDNPSFSAYRYLDVFYVENQSLALDLTIILATFRTLIASFVRSATGRGRSGAVLSPDALEVATP
jgi:exopolysaccharide biosynthesis polyprenyl glycosylphosphotransferase